MAAASAIWQCASHCSNDSLMKLRPYRRKQMSMLGHATSMRRSTCRDGGAQAWTGACRIETVATSEETAIIAHADAALTRACAVDDTMPSADRASLGGREGDARG